ncbi:hypothetical protein A4X13_0g3499 [Tilletia indica]|uniref:Uncharacterized protein n=1 Tax=Tilletia indica TaxID=43049 RepID=A0A8T8T1V3_9BASI|nr:hypothetical protein A4X13_0g3499 [Tilletia indica]
MARTKGTGQSLVRSDFAEVNDTGSALQQVVSPKDTYAQAPNHDDEGVMDVAMMAPCVMISRTSMHFFFRLIQASAFVLSIRLPSELQRSDRRCSETSKRGSLLPQGPHRRLHAQRLFRPQILKDNGN